MIACYGGAMAMFDLLAPITAQGGSCTLPDAEDWMQGRTLYGGASALIAYTAAIRAFPDLPPLRAGQIAFVAPSSGEVDLRREIVRQGRNVTQVRSEIWCEGQCTLTAFWLFGAAREPNAVHPAEKHADWPGGPEENETVLADKGPAFIRNNFELRRAQDQRGPGARCSARGRSVRSTGPSTCSTPNPGRRMAGGCLRMQASTPMAGIRASGCGCGTRTASRCWTGCSAPRSSVERI